MRGIAYAIAARHKAHLALFFKDAFAKLLGHASGHAHQYGGVAARNLTDAAKRAHYFLFRLFTHGTGIDHHHLRVFERRFKTASAERTPQPVGIVHVHLTAKSDDMVGLFDHDLVLLLNVQVCIVHAMRAFFFKSAFTRSSSQSSTARAKQW